MEPMRLHHTEREFNAMRRIYDGLVARAAQDVADKKGKGVHSDYVVGFNFLHGLEGIEPLGLDDVNASLEKVSPAAAPLPAGDIEEGLRKLCGGHDRLKRLLALQDGIEPRHLENPVQKNLLVLLRKLLPPQQKTF